MRPALLALAAALLLSGCVASSTSAPPHASAPDPITAQSTVVETPVGYEGRFALRACTFGSLRHACQGAILVEPGREELRELDVVGAPVRLVGSLRILDDPPKSERVDAFLLHRAPGAERWEIDFPRDPYSSGPSPVQIDWDLAAYAGRELAIFVFTSNAVGTPLVGVSVEPPQDFEIVATLTTTV